MKMSFILSVLLAAPLAFAQAPAPKSSSAPPAATSTARAADKSAAAPSAKPEDKPAVDVGTKKKGLVDINTASADELKALPGVTSEVAEKIIAGRPYKGKHQLLKNGTLDTTAYAKLRPLIVARQPKPDAAQAKGKATK